MNPDYTKHSAAPNAALHPRVPAPESDIATAAAVGCAYWDGTRVPIFSGIQALRTLCKSLALPIFPKIDPAQQSGVVDALSVAFRN